MHVYVSIWRGSGQVSVMAFLACKSICARHCEHGLFCMEFFVPFINFHSVSFKIRYLKECFIQVEVGVGVG